VSFDAVFICFFVFCSRTLIDEKEATASEEERGVRMRMKQTKSAAAARKKISIFFWRRKEKSWKILQAF
jgi:hypothetical protein